MYTHLSGHLITASPLYVVVECGGVGYRVEIPANVHATLPHLGDKILLHTSFVVRELSHTLYGFTSKEERDIFDLLLTISGIGPKLALSIIGHLSAHNLYDAIKKSDIQIICRVPGIGKKSAERLIIEMRDKLPSLFPEKPFATAAAEKEGRQSEVVSDAMSALVNLGYNQASSEKAIKKVLENIPQPIDLAELITLSLKKL